MRWWGLWLLVACDDGASVRVDGGGAGGDGAPAADGQAGGSGGQAVDAVPDAPPDAAPDAARLDGGGGGEVAADQGVGGGGVVEPPVTAWESRAEVAAGPIQEIAVVARQGEVWVIGGFDAQARIVGRVSIYNPGRDEWRAGPDLPVRMHHANAAVVDDRIFVLGYLVGGFASEGRGFVLDSGADEWREVAPMLAGRERGSAGTVAVGRHIYVLGGLSLGRVHALVDRYDVDADRWEALADLPTLRDHMAAGAVDGQVVIAGGRLGDIESQVDRVDVFDPTVNAWRQGTPMPTARGGTAAAVLDGWLYVIGGEGNRAVRSGVFPHVEAYHLASDRWVQLTDMPNPRHGFGAVAVDGRIYVPGGADVQAFGAVATVEVLVP